MELQLSDAVWVAGLPVYAILTTLRHEASHAVAVWASGGRVTRFVCWPTCSSERGFLWGYVAFDGPATRAITAAPYACDLATFAVCFPVCLFAVISSHALWINLIILGVLSPLANSGYNYLRGFFRPNDVYTLRQEMMAAFVHAYFLVTIGVYAVGFIVLATGW